MGIKFCRKEFLLLMKIQGIVLGIFTAASGILLKLGFGATQPFHLLWMIGSICFALDGIVTGITVYRMENRNSDALEEEQ